MLLFRDVPNMDLAAELWVFIYIDTPYAHAYRQQVMVPIWRGPTVLSLGGPFGGDEFLVLPFDSSEGTSYWCPCHWNVCTAAVRVAIWRLLHRYCD